MARTRRSTDAATEPPDADLGRAFHTRISGQADELLRKRARASGLLPATYGRLLLYQGLGLIKGTGKEPTK